MRFADITVHPPGRRGYDTFHWNWGPPRARRRGRATSDTGEHDGGRSTKAVPRALLETLHSAVSGGAAFDRPHLPWTRGGRVRRRADLSNSAGVFHWPCVPGALHRNSSGVKSAVADQARPPPSSRRSRKRSTASASTPSDYSQQNTTALSRREAPSPGRIRRARSTTRTGDARRKRSSHWAAAPIRRHPPDVHADGRRDDPPRGWRSALAEETRLPQVSVVDLASAEPCATGCAAVRRANSPPRSGGGRSSPSSRRSRQR